MTNFKISLFILTLLFWSTSAASAQGIEWSIGAGASFHGHSFEEPLPWWDNSGQLFPSVRLHADVPMNFLEGPLGKMLYLSSGVRYTRLASKVDWEFEVSSNNQVFTGAFQIRQHYLAIPFNFRLHLGQLPVFLIGGPEFGFLMYAHKASDTFTPEEFSSSQTESVGGDLKRINVSLYGGAGVVFRKGLKAFVRYGAGLNQAKKDAERTVLDSDWTTKEIEFGVQLPVFGSK